jgi:hypothetical protein
MVIQIQSKKIEQNLYEKDFYQWIETTVKNLENKEYEAIDWETLIDEVASLGRGEKRRIDSLLTRLLEHLLKLAYWESEKEFNANHWQTEILNFRIQLNKALKDSPSLKPFAKNILAECYQDACKLVSKNSGISLNKFPKYFEFALEQILDEDFYLS